MKIVIYRDLHNEFTEFNPPILNVDLVILAGDIHVNTHGVHWAGRHFPSTQVLYILGNHEYYKGAYPRTLEKIRAQATPLTAAYATNLEELIIEYKPAYWIHRYTHKSSHYKIGCTNVICNPRGYDPDAFNLNFNERRIIEIP